MSINNKASIFVLLGAMAGFGLSTANAESLPKMEREQIGNSARPDVDPNASRGPDASIVKQEKDQFGNSAQPNVGSSASQGSFSGGGSGDAATDGYNPGGKQ